ncbi:MAG: response regulator, partial [Cyanobacteria bacterium P01_G01_bin.38]
LHFEVQDTGPGITPNEFKHLFEPFYQTDTGRQAHSGTGLGLTISRKYAELLGGALTVSSTSEQGSVFAFYLPVTLAQATQGVLKQPERRVLKLAPGQSTYRILVAEDNWESRTLLVKLLAPIGFEVRTAQNGQEAIDVWQTWQPHLIWMDMRMPVIDGYEATQRIRAHIRGQATAIIALTASVLDQERTIILSAGCNDFVRKPFRDTVIFDKMREHLGVQYIYADHLDTSRVSAPPKVEPLDTLCDSLVLMSTSWLSRLQQAARLADADWVHLLIAELPEAQAPLASGLTDLVRAFRCDLIEELANSAQQIAMTDESTPEMFSPLNADDCL